MHPIEIFALSYFGKFSIEEIQKIKETYNSVSEILKSDFFQGNERFKAHYDEGFIQQQLKKIENFNVKLVDFWSEDYPELLKWTHSPPAVLFCLGNIQFLEDSRTVAVVGTRKATGYGIDVTKKMVTDLSRAGFVTVSGMAFGIDSSAHSTALNVGGKTVAVLGTGVDVCYPVSNKDIYEAILKNGCLVSEYPLGTKAAKQNFPARNRIIAGLCRATVVVEAPLNSGALITAKIAAEIGRDVFSVPGDINRKTSEGCNWLIKMGATPLTHVDQIFEYYGVEFKKEELSDNFISLFDSGPLLAEEVAERLKMDLSEVLSKLTEYELRGMISKTQSGHYNRV
ncbi:DNA-processing protein DprA [Pseudothermotoga elfii]|uniref:DNA-processing protein DprA n=1 Tax=Pseudothermotoga elfii TaxID=38322 RepID=UPI0004055F7E|nr:DNA-processing protein DprA [Pseudothermotoga elfii]